MFHHMNDPLKKTRLQGKLANNANNMAINSGKGSVIS